MKNKAGEKVEQKKISDVFGKELKVANLGLEGMALALESQNVQVERIDWKPPDHIYPNLMITTNGISIDDANQEAVRHIMNSKAVLVGMGIAKDTIPGDESRGRGTLSTGDFQGNLADHPRAGR